MTEALMGMGPGEAAGALRFGVTPTVGMYLLPGPLAAYHKAHPGAPVALRVSNTRRLCENLDAGTLRELDLADFQESHDITFLWRKGSVFAPRFRQLHALFFPEAAAL